MFSLQLVVLPPPRGPNSFHAGSISLKYIRTELHMIVLCNNIFDDNTLFIKAPQESN